MSRAFATSTRCWWFDFRGVTLSFIRHAWFAPTWHTGHANRRTKTGLSGGGRRRVGSIRLVTALIVRDVTGLDGFDLRAVDARSLGGWTRLLSALRGWRGGRARLVLATDNWYFTSSHPTVGTRRDRAREPGWFEGRYRTTGMTR
jgi:hypothetical protein